MGVKKKLKKKGGNGRKVLGMLIVLMTVISAFTGFLPVLAEDSPVGEDGMPIPSAMTLTANPEWIYINGDESLITATVYDNGNYTNPIPNMVVFFETTRGILTPVSYGGSDTPDTCWAQTNESGVAIVALAPVIGSESGNATVKAVTGKGDVWKEVTVEFVKAEWRVVLFPDEESKVTEANEDATYYIMVRNAGTADDTYNLSIPSNESDYAALNKTTVSLVANTSEIVTLTVRDSAIGIYNTTVRAESPNASWEVTLMTIVKAFGVEVKVEGGDFAEKKVAPSVDAIYSVTVKNTGTDVDSYDLSVDNVDAADTAELNQTAITNLAAGATAEVLLTVSDATVGEYVVNVTATSQGNPSVSDTISTLTNVSVVAKPDLLVTEINLTSGALFAGQSNEICATVKNNGTADAGAFNVSFLVGLFSEEVRVNGLNAGEDTTVCVTDPTWRIEGESVTILVTADSDAEIEESDETNNDMSIVETVLAGPQPDLLVTEINLTLGALLANQSNEICATVKNNGTAAAGAFNVSFDVDGFSGEVRVGGLIAGEDTTVCVNDTTMRTAGENLTITVTADSDTEIDESNETNNERSIGVTVETQIVSTFNITISQGWNLISIPLTPSNTSLNAVITGAVDYDTIYRWVPGEGYKSAYYGGGDWWGQVNEVEPIEPGVGYWYERVGTQYNLTIIGEPLTGTIETPIYTGWNLVGYASLKETNLSVINDPVNYDTIYRWVPGEGYKSAYYGGGDWWGQVNEVEPIEPGVGYWYERVGADFNWTYVA